MQGGRIYGKGMTGIVEDVPCIKDDPNTFCERLSNIDITDLVLYASLQDKKKTKDLKYILNLLKSPAATATNYVVKTFVDEESFKNEMKAFEKIRQVFSSPSEFRRYTTINTPLTYDNKLIYGICVNYASNQQSTFHVFNEACSKEAIDVEFTPKLFSQFINDISEILYKMHAVNYHHNDIKPDNVIYCESTRKFKLIDWERSGYLTKKPLPFWKCGTPIYNHPLKLYCGGLPSIISRRVLSYVSYIAKHKWISKLSVYKNMKALSRSSFDYLLSLGLTSRQLHEKYAKFYDNYAFGMMIVFLAERNNIPCPMQLVNNLMAPLLPKAMC